jgi:hypothetical protein
MMKTLIAAAILGLSLSAADACEFMRSAEAKVDQTVVASVAVDEQESMSTPQQLILLDEAAPAETEEVPQ